MNRMIKIFPVAAGLVLGGVSMAHAATATTDVNVRAEPGVQGPVVGVLPAGLSAHVVGCQGGWCNVESGDVSGWVSANYLSGSNRAYDAAANNISYGDNGYADNGYAYRSYDRPAWTAPNDDDGDPPIATISPAFGDRAWP